MAISYFLGMQFVTDVTGNEVTLLEALVVAIIITGLNATLWSDWMYKKLSDDGLKINYKTYQIIGILVLLIFNHAIIKILYNEYN